ncbi:MAG: hypothetical protein ACREXV_05110 [Polaromonas sp.]
MARPLRLEFPGALYHVTARGKVSISTTKTAIFFWACWPRWSAGLLPIAVQADKELRDEAIRKACLEFGYTLAATAREVGLHYSTVSEISKIIKGKR